MTEAEAQTTQDHLLGGRVSLRQPARGFRAGLDAVLLAAAIPARPGEAVLEAGCGSGAASLCLAARVPGLRLTAVETLPAMAALARDNAAANQVAITVVEGSVADLGLARRLAPVAHAFANPPYWPAGTPPPGAQRRTATHEDGAALADWAGFLGAALRPGGTATLILPAARFDEGVVALRAAGCGSLLLLPLLPRAGQPAKRVLIQARRDGRGPASLLPGLVLHEADGRFTAEAEAVLRDGMGLLPG